MPPHPSLSSSTPSRPETGAPSSLLEAGKLQFASDRLPWQRSMRWVEPPRERRKWLLGLLFAALVTVLELTGFAVGMRSPRAPPTLPRSNQAVQVILLNPELLPPPPPEPEPPAFVKRPSRIVIAPPKVLNTPPPPHVVEPSDAMSGRLGSAGDTVPTPQLFNRDGSIRLETAPPSLQQAPRNTREASQERWAQIEKRGNPIDCKKTRFSRAFAPDEDAGDKVARKYLKWIGLADMDAIQHRGAQRAESGGCEPSQ